MSKQRAQTEAIFGPEARQSGAKTA